MAKKRDIFASAPVMGATQAKGKVRKLVKRAVEIQAVMEAMRPLYAELDGIISDLVSRGVGPTRVGARTVMLVDNFASRNVAFKTAAVRRWDLRVT